MKIVEILSGLDGGGVENMLFNYCQTMKNDKMKIDFIVHNSEKGALEDKFLELGCSVFHVTSKRKSLLKNTIEIFKIIKNGHYDVVHSHMNYKGLSHMLIAKLCGVKCRIIHQHTAHYKIHGIMKIIVPIMKKICSLCANIWMACSVDSAIDMFGEKNYKKGRIIILKNAINTRLFSYNEYTRKKIRKEMGIEKKFVIGMVGRFHPEKNHEFLIEIFKKILDKHVNSVLVLVGGGELLNEYKEKIKCMNLSNKVIFTGIKNNVYELMQGFDVFVLPTKNEGFGMVLVEAQCAGLNTYTSLEGVPKEVKVTELLHFISLKKKPEEWAEYILSNSTNKIRGTKEKEITNAGYDITFQSKILKNIYLQSN